MLAETELRDTSVLVLANKSDLPNARSAADLCEALNLRSIRYQSWFIQQTSAIKGEGLWEGLDWLRKECTSPKKRKKGARKLLKKAKAALASFFGRD